MPFARLQSLRAGLRRLLAPACVVCGIAPGNPAGAPVCAPCRTDYFAAGAARCRLCANRLPALCSGQPGAPVPDVAICGSCLVRWPRFDATLALADYAPPVDAMIAALKFHGRLDLGLAFGALLAERLQGTAHDAVVPLPLAAPRLRERGYNQSEEIARALSVGLQRPLLRDALVRTRQGASQQGLRLAQRRTNVRGAFLAGPAVAGLRLVLVDDVLTSGSTLDAAAAALKAAGAAWITNGVVARTP
jgi:ComF family protein